MNTIRSRILPHQPSPNATNGGSGVGGVGVARGGGGQGAQRKPFPFYGNATPKHQLRNNNNNTPTMMINLRGLVILITMIIVMVYLFGFFTVFHRVDSVSLTTSSVEDTQHQPPPRQLNTEKKKLLPNNSQASSPKQPQQQLLRQHASHSDTNNNIAAAGGGAAATDIVTVGFAVTITGCGSDPITEGAAVLEHSIRLASIHGPLGGKYDYKMYAIYHPDGTDCALPLKDLGYELLQRDTPVMVSDIQGDYLRTNIEKNGCCGEKELVKLEAYTLIQHPIIVHLDLDVLVLKPLDPLFDWMMFDENNQNGIDTYDTTNVPIMWPKEDRPHKVNAFFTRDYNMVGPSRTYKPVQGGFLVLRPDMAVYDEFVDIIKKGDFRQKGGWGGIVGPFYGSMTFQGIIPYFYDYLHMHQAVELNRCIYNQMADNPKDKRTVNDIPQGRCRTNEEECEDCRNRQLEDVVTVHFTLCQKPWLCLPQNSDVIQQRLCRKFHHEWHRIRSDLEQSWGRSANGPGEYHQDHFYGHCSRLGKMGYQPIEEPYGKPLDNNKLSTGDGSDAGNADTA